MLRVAALLLILVLTACEPPAVSYPPPPQARPASDPEPPPGSFIVNMNDVDAADHFVADISPGPEGSWRWTQKRPTVKILLVKTTGLKFVVDFSIAEVTMKQTGPLTISFFVGLLLLDKIHYATSGTKHFEKPVDPAWLQTVTETQVSAEVDKVYIAPADQAPLGIILIDMGFEPR